MLISIDWLQLHLEGNINWLPSDKIIRLPYQTRQFKYIDEYYIDKRRFCTITHTPLSSILSDKMVLLKVDNEFLYEKGYLTHLHTLIAKLNLKIIGLSRIDICADFNTFYNNLEPMNLIRRFFTCKYRKIDMCKFKAMGEQKRHIEFDYLRYGTNNSVCCSYLYNKSKEMNEVKMKSYIFDSWQCSGLDIKKDVWRLEFSLKGNTIKLNDLKTGELIPITLEFISNKDNLKDMYYALQDKYFKFRYDTGKSNVSREKIIQLLPPSPLRYQRYIFREAGDGTKSDKIFIKKLENLNNELRAMGSEYQANVYDILTHFTYEKGLTDFYNRKINGIVTNSLKRMEFEDKNTIFRMKSITGGYKHTWQLALPFNAYSQSELILAQKQLNI
jgi:hypothetical protein